MLVFLEGDGKFNGKAPKRNERVALGDRTNVEAAQVEIPGKPPVQITRPITRSLSLSLYLFSFSHSHTHNSLQILDFAGVFMPNC